MTSSRHQGIKSMVHDPAAINSYMSVMDQLKGQAEATVGTQFGPKGTNGHLSAIECGRVGGAMTKNVFLSFAGSQMPPMSTQTTQAQAQHLQ